MPSIWVTLGPLILLNAFFLVTLLVFLTKRDRLPPVPDMALKYQSAFLSKTLHAYWYWLTEPLVRLFVRMRMSPNILTILGFSVSCVAAVYFAKGIFGVAGWIMILGATFDMFDGRVARLTGQSSRSGAFFDSVMDRFAEGLLFLGVTYYFRSTWMLPVTLVALIGSLMVSYTRARGEGVGVVCKGGPMQRPERMAYLGVASIFDPIARAIAHAWITQPPPILLMGALCIIAVLTVYTSFYRLIYVMDALDTADRARDGEETIPQLISKLSTRQGREDVLARARYGYSRGQARCMTSLIFVVDGLQSELLQDLLRTGALPNIARHVVEPGGAYEATSVFPSTAGIASTPIVTGCFPGTCNVPGMRWFDRTVPPERRFTMKRFRDYYAGMGAYAIDFDLSKEVKTIFEYSRQAVNLLGMINRGSGLRRDPAFLHSPQQLLGLADSETMVSLERTAFEWFSHSVRREADFVYYYFPTISHLAKLYGIDDQRVREAYRRFDQYVGDAIEVLKDAGLYDHAVVGVVGDHGHGEVRQQFDLDTVLTRRLGELIPTASPTYRQWLDAKAINMVSGNGMANLYVRKAQAWGEAQFIEALAGERIVDALLEHPAVDFVMGRSEQGGVRVYSRRGLAHIEGSGEIRYTVEGSDPFGYGALPSKMTSREALEYTAATEYPDGIVQALQLFRSTRAGDVILSAAPAFAFAQADEEELVTHGGLHRANILVPYLTSSAMQVPRTIRTADILPTTMDAMGLSPNHTMDGANLSLVA